MRLLKHDRDKVGDFQRRALLHLPVGFLCAASALGHWVLPLILTAGFMFYEKNEDLHTKDQAWKDTFGWLVGAVAGSFLVIGLRLSGIL
ncbi:MAG: hypothetical protein DRP11_04685 [Candidatus Aenigmatarchaeota archaeon]|nr:MAG: hypothetical protein DRP11_04685 [Candidatus Aenigmarchaeota archaeon]